MNDDLQKRLNPGGTYNEEEQRVRDWVYQNRKMFIEQAWTVDEVAMMARLVEIAGLPAIISVLSHFQDALRGSHVENRAAVKDFSFDMAVQQFHELARKQSQDPWLTPLWEDVAKKEKGD